MDNWTTIPVKGEGEWKIFNTGSNNFFAVIVPCKEGSRCIAYIQTRVISRYQMADGSETVTENSDLEIKRAFSSEVLAKRWIEKKFQERIKEALTELC